MTIEAPHYALDGNQYRCKCVGKHIPKALELHRHHVWPLGEGGPDVRENLVILCPTTHSNVHRLWRLYDEYNGRPPWDILKTYSEYTRAIVERGREERRKGTNTGPIASSKLEATITLPTTISA